MANAVQIAFTTTAPGPFTLAHNLGTVPGSVIFEMTSGGAVWFQTARFDATNLYLIASDAGLTGYAIVYASATPITPSSQFGNSTIRLQAVADDRIIDIRRPSGTFFSQLKWDLSQL